MFEVRPYGSRHWAVYRLVADGPPELVCVTVYKRGAVAAVRALVLAGRA